MRNRSSWHFVSRPNRPDPTVACAGARCSSVRLEIPRKSGFLQWPQVRPLEKNHPKKCAGAGAGSYKLSGAPGYKEKFPGRFSSFSFSPLAASSPEVAAGDRFPLRGLVVKLAVTCITTFGDRLVHFNELSFGPRSDHRLATRRSASQLESFPFIRDANRILREGSGRRRVLANICCLARPLLRWCHRRAAVVRSPRANAGTPPN